jgi:hypothetical protein
MTVSMTMISAPTLEELEGLCDVVHQPQAHDHIETFCKRVLEDVALLEAVARGIDALGLEHEARLIELALTSINAQQEVRSGVHRIGRPIAGVAAQVEHAMAFERSSHDL